jgi:hypothetical protein
MSNKQTEQAVGINAAAASRITGIQVSTANMWIQRGLVPGMEVGTQGVERLFDIDTVLHLSVMGALGRLGIAAPLAAIGAAEARNGYDPGARLIVGPPRKNVYGLGMAPTFTHIVEPDLEQFDAALNDFIGGRPEAFVTVELDRLAARVKRAFSEPDLAERARRRGNWPERRSVRGAKR